MSPEQQQQKLKRTRSVSDILYKLSRRSRLRRMVIIISLASLVVLFLAAHYSLSPVYQEQTDYHPINGRFLHKKPRIPESRASFNALASHDILRKQFNERRRRGDLETYGRKNVSISRRHDTPAYSSQQLCSCNSSIKEQRQSSRYPFRLFKDGVTDTFSIVILTYNRSDLLLRLLNHYSAMANLERIVVVWNAKETAFPAPEEEWAQLGPHPVPVEFKVQTDNKLRNRLQVFPEIESSGVFLVDDDLLISARDVQFAFRVWKEFPHLIVGYFPRKHVQSPVSGLYTYGSDELDSVTDLGSLSYSMILTGAAFVHQTYVRMFNDHNVVPPEVHKLVDVTNNCEDIAMNVMVGRYLLGERRQPHCAGLFVKPVQLQNLERETNSGYKGLWHEPSHLAERSFCLNHLADIYNCSSLPLFYSDLAMVPMQTAMAKCARLN